MFDFLHFLDFNRKELLKLYRMSKQKQRIIISSQNNPLFRGIHVEQCYDQRDGLAQVGAGDIVVTTDPIDPYYIKYWKGLGFDLPHLVVAGPFDERYILSELILNSKRVQKEILDYVPSLEDAQVEFFTVSQSEENLLKTLGISSDMNIPFSERFQRKTTSKKLFANLGISTLPYTTFVYTGENQDELVACAKSIDEHQCILKKDLGTGGIALGGMFLCDYSKESLDAITPGTYVIEPVVEILTEISCHWHIDDGGKISYLGLFEQLAENTSYIGVQSHLEYVSSTLFEQIIAERERLVESIATLGGRGYMCCDIIITTHGEFYWSDLNPRKGAAIYIVEAMNRLRTIHDMDEGAFYHKHFPYLKKGLSFCEVQNLLGDLLDVREEGFVLITNPGIIPYGYLDITAFAKDSQKAKRIFEKTLLKIQ